MESPYILKCSRCRRTYSPKETRGACIKCGGVLLVEYDTASLGSKVSRSGFGRAERYRYSQWRYLKLLPVTSPRSVVTLGEGFTHIYRLRWRGVEIYVKDESRNPTGTFKDRGISVALSAWGERGYRKYALATAGNAGVSLAAYSRVARYQSIVFAPKDTPRAILFEASLYGSEIEVVDGTISDASRKLNEYISSRGEWINISTGREPYRFEGDKTMGLEIIEQLKWEVPDAVVYPLGGGEGLIGIWKAVRESIELGLVKDEKKPRFIVAQPDKCSPIVDALERGAERSEPVEPPERCRTIATGLNTPKPYADYLIIDIVRGSGGAGYRVAESEILETVTRVARSYGIYPSPEAAAAYRALDKAIDDGVVERGDRIVVIQTASGAKYSMELARMLS